ncbi:MAG TPA: DUF1565 domain-containing protein, partial [bacterium]|nr:DUF1565 domain-containing protein [bacterium]
MCTSSSTDVPSIQYSLTENYWPGIGNITGDPNLIDPDRFDYRLRAGSPCIDAGDPDDPVPPGGGTQIDMGCFEYPHQPQLYLDTVAFNEETGDHDGIPELGETIRPTLMVCNFGEPATNTVADFTLVHPDTVMTIPNVTIGDLDFEECRTLEGPTFEVTGQSGWCAPVTLTGDWTSTEGQGTLDIPFSLHGNTVYVDPVNGDDQTGSGSPDNPLKTIRKACLRAIGSRFFPLTVQMTEGVYSESTNGEFWPIYMNEYEDLRGEGNATTLINETYRSAIIQSSRTSSFYDFSMLTDDDNRHGIRADCVRDVVFSGLSSPYYEDNGCAVLLRSQTKATVTHCTLGGVTKEWNYTQGDEITYHHNETQYTRVMGNSTITDCIMGPGLLTVWQEIPHPSNTVENNIITGTTEIKNQNVFENNICYGVWIETEVDFPIQNNFGYGTFLVNESSGTVSFNNNIVVRDTWGPNSFECWWSAAPECNNCISIPLIRTQGEFNNYSGSYGAIGLDGSVAIMGYT